jgi:uncharacterized protein
MLVRAGISAISLSVEDMASVISAARQFELDFDDAYQYVVAARYDLTIASFDSDFGRTDRGRRMPAELLSG